jgi:hypothetical protein
VKSEARECKNHYIFFIIETSLSHLSVYSYASLSLFLIKMFQFYIILIRRLEILTIPFESYYMYRCVCVYIYIYMDSFLTPALDGCDWSGSCPGRALPPGKGPLVPNGLEAGWASELVWTQRLEEKSFASARV